MKKRLKEMEEEAAALRDMQAKVEKEMSAVQGTFHWQDRRMRLAILLSRVPCHK